MNRLHIIRVTDSLVRFLEGRNLYDGSTYEVVVEADCFKHDVISPATLVLESGGEQLVTCNLDADPLRRGVRLASLTIDSGGHSEGFMLCCKLAGDVVFRAAVPVWTPAGTSGGGAAPGSRWTTVDLGTVSGSSIELADMTQAMATLAGAGPVFNIVTGPGFTEGYVSAATAGGFPFSSIKVDGADPMWIHMDSLATGSTSWLLHLIKVAGVVRASLFTGKPVGVEADPDGDLVTGVEVSR